jgi:hypothetical protein
MDHLQDILARLNGSAEVNRENHSPAPGSASSSNYQQPSVSSPIYTPSPSGLQPRHSSATIVSPTWQLSNHSLHATNSQQSPNPPALHSSADFSNATSNRGTPDLLGLLKSRQNLQSSSSSAAQSAVLSRAAESSSSPSHPPESTADFIATWGRKPSQFGSVQSPSLVAPSQSRPELRGEATSSSGNPQDFLLKLLNQAKTDAPVLKKTEKATDPYQAPQVSAFSLSRSCKHMQLLVIPNIFPWRHIWSSMNNCARSLPLSSLLSIVFQPARPPLDQSAHLLQEYLARQARKLPRLTYRLPKLNRLHIQTLLSNSPRHLL